MSTAVPQVPPRPARAHNQETSTSAGASLGSDMPRIPPRPVNRRADRSMSPTRESFARSPLNEAPTQTSQPKPSIYSSGSANNSSSDLPRPPSSVALPSIGQEGNEYAEVFDIPDLATSPTQTRNIANDLKLHAPRPSLPESSAKARVSTVTRTDSSQAAAFGIGKASGDDKDPGSRSLKSKTSFASQTSNGPDRPPSSMEGEHGIPEIGQRVPMYPNAGDVQAPSPASFATPFTAGIGFHNDGSKPRNHGRKTSARGVEAPPGSYGLHGHGVIPHDRFEKAYYEKHPELYKKETGLYHGPLGEGRAEWAMSSEDLNKIVRDTASRGAGLGTSPLVMSTPTEQIGFQATEEYASRISSPRSSSAGPSGDQVSHLSLSQTHAESPLKNEGSIDASGKDEFEGALSRSLAAHTGTAAGSETEDDDVIHVDSQIRPISKVYGDSTDDLGSHTGDGGEEDGFHNEHGYGAPILASDEVAKEPFGWELQPAVSPANDRGPGYYDESGYPHSASSVSGSRPSSRPVSIHGNAQGLRLPESTPLEDLEEYEPLFPEDDKGNKSEVKKPLTAADRLKNRPELKNRRFPSQDIWEDTPNSLQYTATVSAPQLPEDKADSPEQANEEDTPEKAFARKQEELAEKEFTDTDSFLNREKKPWANKSHLVAETRPGIKQRFPSRDIWEDTPDSLQLQTTVASPQSPEKDVSSPADERPTTGAVVYHQEKAAAGFELGREEGRATTGIAAIMKPSIPARPTRTKPSESPDKGQPTIPERPSQRLKQALAPEVSLPPVPLKSKPQIPARPSKLHTRESSENVPLTTIPSNSSTKSSGSDQASSIVSKPKPPVPSRPIGSKIAALQGGFMADLNSRLKLGPQAPKKEEPAPEEKVEEKEKVPLQDARKGRARGPARRAPAKSPAPSVEATKPVVPTYGLASPATLWHIDPDEETLHVPPYQDEPAQNLNAKAAQSSSPILTTNTAGEGLHDQAEIAPEASHEKNLQESPKESFGADEKDDRVEPIKPSDESPVVLQSAPPASEAASEDLSASTGTLKPEPTDENVE